MSEHACDVDWLFQKNGPSDPAWLARVRAEVGRAPVLIATPAKPPRPRWAQGYDCCRVCGTTETPHNSHGRCIGCRAYWRQYGAERPARLWQRKERAS